MTVPVRVLRVGDHDPEPEGLHYVVAENGVFLHIDNNWVRALVPASDADEEVERVFQESEVGSLDEAAPRLEFKPRPMPAETFYRVAKFFRQVRDKMRTEVAVLFHYGDEVGWDVTVPSQEVTAGHVSYQMTAADSRRVRGARVIGTSHSHVDMGAWHSGVDEGDEAEFDGLHVTIGRVCDLPGAVDIDAQVVVRGHKFKAGRDFDLSAVIEGLNPRPRAKLAGASHVLADPAAYEEVIVPEDWHAPVKRETRFFERGPRYGRYIKETGI